MSKLEEFKKRKAGGLETIRRIRENKGYWRLPKDANGNVDLARAETCIPETVMLIIDMFDELMKAAESDALSAPSTTVNVTDASPAVSPTQVRDTIEKHGIDDGFIDQVVENKGFFKNPGQPVVPANVLLLAETLQELRNAEEERQGTFRAVATARSVIPFNEDHHQLVWDSVKWGENGEILNKIEIIKIIRAATNCELKSAKEFIEGILP